MPGRRSSFTTDQHTIEFHGVADIREANGDPVDLYFTVDIIYHLTVVGE